jgi:hypothetical protein
LDAVKAAVLLSLGVLAAAWVFRWSLIGMLRQHPNPVPCSSCGIAHASRNVFGLCAACQERAERAEQIEREIRMRAYDANTARWRAEREAERIAARFPLVKVGSIYRNECGEPVFDGFEFNDPTGQFPPGPNQVSARSSRSSLIAGWTQDELHHLAHGEACRCLD